MFVYDLIGVIVIETSLMLACLPRRQLSSGQLWLPCTVNKTAIESSTLVHKLASVCSNEMFCALHATRIQGVSLYCVDDGRCEMWDEASLFVGNPQLHEANTGCFLVGAGCTKFDGSGKVEVGELVPKSRQDAYVLYFYDVTLLGEVVVG
ncbi:uncharacterized protein LOC108674254 [Hyalella azteca]|uniref:Uncharacterized protein LOC108674254 n=1 Tax=Hyalella azteca TaxID=294128 RepID=A0A8B7NVD3_HYAAZ|nr:uncharacterized protein LOC108674254 [Hyalella azteca]